MANSTSARMQLSCPFRLASLLHIVLLKANAVCVCPNTCTCVCLEGQSGRVIVLLVMDLKDLELDVIWMARLQHTIKMDTTHLTWKDRQVVIGWEVLVTSL